MLGLVIVIIDGDTFDLKITHTGNNNRYKYNTKTRIRIADIDAPELNTASGKRSKELLEKRLKDKEVRCYVQSKDTYGRIVAEVEVLN